MKKLILTSLFLLSGVSGLYAQACQIADNPFVYKSGKLSLGVVNGDTLALYDIFKHVDGITARVGASVTIAQYDRFGAFVGAAAPTADPSAVALVAGPSLDLNDIAKAATKAILGALPFKIDATTEENLAKATRLKLYGGYDFRYKGSIAGVGFGIELF